jgi:HPt (histidine-containing phosphotransfer) domain-containing protein
MGQLSVLFLATADARIDAMHRALAGDDTAGLVSSAHTLCGASANLGATDLARLCASIERGGALVGGAAMIDAVELELGRVRTALGALAP